MIAAETKPTSAQSIPSHMSVWQITLLPTLKEHRPMAIPIIRLYTGDDGESHFEETSIETVAHGEVVVMTKLMDCHEVQFAQTASGGGYDWHNAPRRQFVITLEGTLEFENRLGDTQMIRPAGRRLFWRRTQVAIDG
jgi:hypothetical protein